MSTASTELAHVRYHLDASVSGSLCIQLTDLLKSLGAQPGPLTKTSSRSGDADAYAAARTSLDTEAITHVITNTSYFEGHEDVEAHNAKAQAAAAKRQKQVSTAPIAPGQRGELIAVVTPRWVTRTADFGKRQDEQYYSADPSKLFSGVVVCTEELLEGDSETIKGVVAALGGQWRQSLVVEVTHLITMTPSGKKYDRIMQSGWKLGMKAVVPHWIDDCVKLGQRVPEDDYTLPDPPFLSNKLTGHDSYLKRMQMSSGAKDLPVPATHTYRLLDAHTSSRTPKGKQKSTSSLSSNGSGIGKSLEGKTVYIAMSCGIEPGRRQMYSLKIESAGGKLLAGKTVSESLQALQNSDIVIVKYREGWEFWKAYQLQKEIGNVDWLVKTLFQAAPSGYQPPTAKLLHYPLPNKPLPQFQGLVFSVSSYTGETRETLKKLIELLGATFEGNLTKGKTSHLISPVCSGSKAQHAMLWGVPVLNQRWIEDCFVQWKKVDHQNERYQAVGQSDDDLASMLENNSGLTAADIKAWADRDEATDERTQSLEELERTVSIETVAISDSEPEEMALDGGDFEGPVELLPSQHTNGTETLKSRTAEASPSRSDSSEFEGKRASPPKPVKPSQAKKKSSSYDSSDGSAAGEPDGEGPHVTSSEDDQALEDEMVRTATNGKAGPASRKRKEPEPSTSSESDSPPPATARPKARPSVKAGALNSSVARKTTAPKAKRSKPFEAPHVAADMSVNDTPRTHGGRKAAEAAARRLHEVVMPDVLEFVKEQQGGGKKRLDEMFGGRGKEGSVERSSARKKNGLSSPAAARRQAFAASDDDSRGQGGHASSSQYGQQSPPTPHVQWTNTGRLDALRRGETSAHQPGDLTSFDAPPGQKHAPKLKQSKIIRDGGTIAIASTGVPINDSLRRELNRMGARMLDDKIEGCTHLIVKGISRTVKFLSCMSYGSFFVTEQWAIDSVNNRQFLDEERYLLRDREGESKHGIVLAKSLAQARRSKVFEDQTFYLTPKVVPDFESLRTIAEAGGAKVVKKIPTVKQVQDRADVHVISSIEERALWESLYNAGLRVYSGEAIIRMAMTQSFDLEEYVIEE